MKQDVADISAGKPPLLTVLGDEGFRLFFPLSAAYGALWPFLWVALHEFDLPFAEDIPPTVWHMHEMIVGAFGAALIGFITTAAPEWTDTEPLRGKPIYGLAGLWTAARLPGLLGADSLSAIGGMADLLWMGFLLIYMIRLSVKRQTDRLLIFVAWMALLIAVEMITRFAMVTGDASLANQAARAVGFVFLCFLGTALGRITVPVTNLVLDPSEESSPFRPHPGRLNLASSLVLVALAGEVAGLSDSVCGFLWIAAGAGFFDRVAESFVGREFFRTEILALSGSALFAGLGLLLLGVSLLGGPVSQAAALHLAFMGGLGIGVYTVFAIAGLLHSGRTLPFPSAMRACFLLLLAATILRTGPDLGFFDHPPGPLYLVASLCWAGAAFVWLRAYWPILTDPGSVGRHG